MVLRIEWMIEQDQSFAMKHSVCKHTPTTYTHTHTYSPRFPLLYLCGLPFFGGLCGDLTDLPVYYHMYVFMMCMCVRADRG